MKFKPHNYQTFTTDFITHHPEAAVFLGMGLGKTIITLTAIQSLILDSFEVHKALIIAPLRVARDTWPTELTKWDHLTELTMATCVGTPKQRRAALNQSADITVINRETVPWLVNHYNANDTPWPFDMVVIDELSSFKNHQAARFKALKQVRPHIRRIVGLTGTPAPNSLLDLWAPMRLIDEGQRLGKFITHYRNQYFLPDKRNGHQIFSYKLRDGAEQEIYDRIADITVSMRTTDYLQLPPLTITDYPVTMSRSEVEKYEQLKKTMVLELDSDEVVDAPTAAVLAGKLQQVSSGAIYTGEQRNYLELHGRKLDALEDIVESANGAPVLVAYWFVHELARILARFPNAVPLSSSEDFQAWNRGEVQVGLIHPASAGHGLNLQDGGHLLVWLTLPWSLDLVEQTNARLFRQGQTHPVTITRIICAGTIDTQVGAALETKNATQSALIDAVKAELEP